MQIDAGRAGSCPAQKTAGAGTRTRAASYLKTMSQNGTTPSFPFAADVAFQAGDIVFATDRVGRVVYWNEEAAEITGYSAAEVLGKPYTIACRMELEGEAPVDLASILAGRDFAGARRCHTRGGGEVALYLFATAGRNQSGETAGVVFVGRDVTGLWSAEDVVQASADKYRVLFEHTPDAVAIVDMKGRVLEANPAYLRLYGCTVQDVRSMSLLDVVAPEDRPAATKALASLASGRQVAKTMRMRRKDGTGFVVDLLASTMTVGGEPRILSVTRDVTERARSEQARTQSELLYRTVFESANDAVFIEAVEGRILDVNRNGCELLGYTRNELMRKNVADLVPPESRVWLQRVTDAVLRDGTFRSEAVRVHKDGHRIPVEISASTMELDGRTAVLTIVRDISRRKRAEQALRESEEKFRSVSEQSPNMVFINAGGRVVYANQRSVDVMRYTREELYAPDFDFMRLIAPESQKKIAAVYARHLRGEEVEPYEYSLVTREGRRIESIITTKLIEYDGTRAILGIVTDITERVRAVRALRDSEEKYRSVVERASDGICVVQDGRLAYLNPRLAQMVGYEPNELVGKEFAEYLHPHDRQAVVERYRRRLAGERQPTTYSVRLVAHGEGEVPVELNVGMATYDGAPAEIVLVRDVTERARAEQALRESERQYRTALEAMRDPVHVADTSLRIVMVNQAFTAWLRENGLDEAVIGKKVFEAFPFLPKGVRAEYRQVIDTGEPIVTEEETVVAGRTFTTETTKMPVTEHGTVVRVLTAIRDVTERRRLASLAEETADGLRAVLDNSPGAIAGECEDVLVYANQRFARLFGYESPAEVIGRPAGEFDAPQDRERLSGYTRLREQGKDAPTSYSFHGLRRDGTVMPLEATISTYRSLGRLHVLAFIREEAPGA
jgi:PAS domain S-box-containing protein